MFLTIFKNRKTNIGEVRDFSLQDLAKLFSHPITTKETLQEFLAMSKDEQSELKDRGGYIAGVVNGARGKGCVTERTAITLDLDEGEIFTADCVQRKCKYHYFLHSTRKHTKEHPRYRLIIPLSQPVEAKDYELLARTVAKDLDIIDNADNTTYQPERMMYWPTISSDGKDNFVFIEGQGELLNPETVLIRYVNRCDMALWPMGNNEKHRLHKTITEHTQNQDPLSKPGWIGAFNRAYPIKEAIATFLVDVYEPTRNYSDRYNYLEADSTGGLVIYDNTAYSHHATDPVCGQLCNAFDLVRLHLFGEDDFGIDMGTPIMQHPSMIKMLDLCSKDNKVKAEMNEDFANAIETGLNIPSACNRPADADTWQKDLIYSKKGELENNIANFTAIINNDPRLQGICFNDMSGNLAVTKKVPWRDTGGEWKNNDNASLNVFIGTAYNIYSPTKIKDALIAVAESRHFHPLKFYFSQLPQWDKIPRVDTMLVKYLGAEDTPLNRAVTRKTLLAAVARIYKPGIKFDTVLVLVGPQGIGKSTVFAKLAGQYFSDSLSLTDMKDKTAAEKLAGKWIVELSELAGGRKADAEMVKSFLTRCDDSYRPAYGSVTESHPRQCIIVGTTNLTDGFLYDTTGNRRFWPVNVKGGTEHHPWELTKGEIDQIWAEAKYYYDKGEDLTLDNELTEQIAGKQEELLITDERVGIVQQYLDGNNKNTISKIEIWCEALDMPKEQYNNKAQRDMGRIMNSLPDWEYGGSTRIEGYGKQKIYKRRSGTFQEETVPQIVPLEIPDYSELFA